MKKLKQVDIDKLKEIVSVVNSVIDSPDEHLSTENISTWRWMVDERDRKIKELSCDSLKVNQIISSQEVRILNLTADCNNLYDKVESLKLRIRDLESSGEYKRKEIDTLRAQLKDTQDKYSILHNTSALQRKEIDAQRAQLKSLQDKYDSLCKDYVKQGGELVRARDKNPLGNDLKGCKDDTIVWVDVRDLTNRLEHYRLAVEEQKKHIKHLLSIINDLEGEDGGG